MSYILNSSPKGLLMLYHNSYILLFCIDLSTKWYQDLWFNRIQPPLFQTMSVKAHINSFLSSGSCNFKISYLKDKTRYAMSVHILLNNLASFPLHHGYYFWCMWSQCYEKAVKFYPGIFELKVFMLNVTIVLFYC